MGADPDSTMRVNRSSPSSPSAGGRGVTVTFRSGAASLAVISRAALSASAAEGSERGGPVPSGRWWGTRTM